ncbi:defensin 2 [Lasioglossum baleicum]|uniref:defensin 2 n=1 Tax=Lasioglossum baleicum TaxID=434251 RepID=UPI003FCCA472
MKLFAVLCVFVVISYASAASIPQDDGPSYELKRVDERDADADAYADAISDAVASAIAEAGGFAGPNAFAGPIAFADPKAAALPDDDVNSRPRRFSCDVLSFTSKWFSVNHAACATRCLFQRRRGGRCQNGVCVCR